VRALVDNTLGSLSDFAFVTAVNSPPAANNDTVTLPQDSSETFASVLANDTDEDSTPTSLKAALVAGPTHGTLVFNANGTFTYTPAPGFVGTDSFTYQANNGVWSEDASVPMSENSNIATVTIEVHAD
jgi:VCBS repeat-containing protein